MTLRGDSGVVLSEGRRRHGGKAQGNCDTYMANFRKAFLLAFTVCATLTLPGGIHGQTVDGQVEGAPGRMLVVLLGDDDQVMTRGVTDNRGVFQMPAPGAGRYRVRVDRVGFESTWSEAFMASPGGRITLSVDMPAVGRDLMSLPSPPVGVCRNPGSAPDRLAAAWAEAEKALRLLQWTEDGAEVVFDALVYQRELEGDGETVSRAEAAVVREGVRRVTQPTNPADLLDRGFIREAEDGGYQYFGVTPEVLLASGFLETHCFRLQEGGGALLGLAFEPLNRRPESRPDVAGVLWLQAQSGRPVLMEFGYRNVDPTLVPAGASGQTTFAELPDGSWVIPETWLRMPLVQLFENTQTGEERWQLQGLLENRVRLLRVREGAEVWSITPETGAIEGMVMTVTGGAVAGADVSLVGAPMRTASDAGGRYRFDGLLEGTYRVAVEHPSFNNLPLGPPVTSVSVAAGETGSALLAPPSPEEAAGQLCTGSGLQANAIITGQLTDLISGEPLVGIPIAIRFPDPRRDGTPYHEARTTTGAGGYYLYCDAPEAQMVRLRPQIPGSGFEDDIEFMAGRGVTRRDLQVRFSTEISSGGMFGLIRENGTRNGIEQAQVRLKDTNLSAMTNRNGFFAFQDIEPGLYVVIVSHLAFEDREVVVRVDSGAVIQLNVELLTDAIPIEGITVSVMPRRLFSDMVDLQRRMELGFGSFMMREELALRGGTLGTALQGQMGVQVLNGISRAGERFVVLRSARDLNQAETGGAEGLGGAVGAITFDYCYPAVWIDGRRWSRPKVGGIGHDPVDFSQFITEDIEAIEIYRGAASVPGEFGGGDAACGAVILWTRRGGRTVRGDMGGGPGRSGGSKGGGG